MMRSVAVLRTATLAMACFVMLLSACAGTARKAPTLPVSTIGTRNGAAYRIDIPANWNHELIVYYHGYRNEPAMYDKDKRIWPALDGLLGKGYALIQSGYSRGGWAIEQAYAETEVLRRDFVAAYGEPTRSWVLGESMGGALTALTIETRPEIYSGALALCGAIWWNYAVR